MLKLSDRLKLVYDLIPECDSVADIGCDHGYLSIALVQGKKANKVIAMDINKGPVEAAIEHVRLYGLSEHIEVRKSDGLDRLVKGEAQVIAICGMGGALMQRIIDNHIDLCQEARCLVVEPQSEIYEFRSFLQDRSFAIQDEEICVEENKYYPIMRISYCGDGSKLDIMSQEQLKYGPCLLRKAPTELLRLLDKDEAEYQRIKSELEKKIDNPDDNNGPIRNRILELEDDLSTIKKARQAMGR